MKNDTNIKKNLDTQGYAFLSSFGLDESTEVIAKTIGELVKIPNLSLVQTLRPARKEHSTKNVYSGNYGLCFFPLHSDLAHWYMPPRYLMLRSIVPSSKVYTSFLKTEDALAKLNPSIVQRSLFQPRKPIEGRLPLLRFHQYCNDHDFYRWDRLFLNPANQEAERISEHIRSLDNAHSYMMVYLKNKGDILLLDNWMMLHGRSNVTGHGINRVVKRVYLSEVHG